MTSPSRTRSVGKVAPLCRASAQARRSRSTARTEPVGPTASAKGTENRPAPAYRSTTDLPVHGPTKPSTASSRAAAAPVWTCQNTPGEIR